MINRGNKLSYLSSREKEVLHFLVRGFTAKMISSQLIISPRTVEHHLKNIKDKTGVNSKPRLIAAFFDDFKGGLEVSR